MANRNYLNVQNILKFYTCLNDFSISYKIHKVIKKILNTRRNFV